jgi:hypothetical protein
VSLQALQLHWLYAPIKTFVKPSLMNTFVSMKNTVSWDVAPCRSCVNRSFGGMYRLHLQGTKIRERGTRVSRWLAD